MNILVTGANGQLGNSIRMATAPEQKCGDLIALVEPMHNFIFTDINQPEGVETVILDITDLEAVRKMVREQSIGVIVNCAAYTNVDGAEDAQEVAELLNAKAPENLAVAMNEVGGLLVHVSTDYVFGAEPYNTPCKEEQKGTPTGVYGLTKLHGEQAIEAIGCNHVIIRTSWLYSEYGKNFCKTMLNLTATKPQLKVVFDQVGTPTYAMDLAKAILVVLGDYGRELSGRKYSKTGIYHFSNEGVCSWYDFAKMIAAFAGQTECNVQPCHSNEFPSPVIRPSYSVLDKTKIKDTFGVEVPYWVDSLQQCISNLKAEK